MKLLEKLPSMPTHRLHVKIYCPIHLKTFPQPKCLRLQNSKYFAWSDACKRIHAVLLSRALCVRSFCGFVPFSISFKKELLSSLQDKCLYYKHTSMAASTAFPLKKCSRPAGIYGNLFAVLRKVNYFLPLVLLYF